MDEKTVISIAAQYSASPGGRYRTDGPNSGQRFREDVLLPTLNSQQNVIVDLDGVLGYGSSFLEEAFGGLVRAGLTEQDLRARLKIHSSLPVYVQRVWNYIHDAQSRAVA